MRNRDEGVWLVRLLRAGAVDHYIVVDGVRKLIYDSSKRYSLRLSVDALIHCGGGIVGKLAFAEIRQIHPVMRRAKMEHTKS